MGSVGPDREAKEFTPHLYPPFPTDTKPCVELKTFSLSKLRSADLSEQARLYETCKTRGFFYLDLNDTYAGSLPEAAESIAHLSEDVFALSQDEKMKYSGIEKMTSIFGYKQAGATKVDVKGTLDTAEFFNCPKDEILETAGRNPFNLPSLLTEPASRSLIGEYQKTCHQVGLELLNILGAQLGVPADAFNNKHRITATSGDHVRMTRGPPRKSPELSLAEIQTPGHTDFGTITILFNWLGGLQVWSEPSRGNFHNIVDPNTNTDHEGWLWVNPKPGHAIINLGDAAVKFTGGVLCSARHRVVPAPGEQGLWPRYSIVYFVRPEDKTILERMKGREVPVLEEGGKEDNVTAAEWIMKQVKLLTEGSNNKK